jgi:2-polyprenyl-6-methoxyphenol hydroxylase-like FAD-dependent oxidoreductase
MSGKRALVIGGSVGGLFAAAMLRHVGWDATVFERNPEELAGRGAGISTHPQLGDVVRRLGVAFDDSMAIHVDRVIFLDHTGRTYDERETTRTMSSWGRIYRSLRDLMPESAYRLGKSLQRIEQDDNGVTAIFADGSRERGDILVGADGGRSTVREQMLPGLEPSYAGYVAWRAMLQEREFPPALHAAVFERYSYCLPQGELCLAYPVPGLDNETQPGHRAYNIVWYRPTSPDALRDLCTDANGVCHGTSIPLPLIRPEAIAGIRRTARELVAPQIAEILERCAQPFFQAIFDLASPRIAFGRVAVLGDAAFVARPHPGAGTTKAAMDAAALADAVAAEGAVAGLARYDREQRPFGTGIVALGRREGSYLTAQLKPASERTPAQRRPWDIDDLMHSHNSRSAEVRRVLDEARSAKSSPDSENTL